jgi:uncharacterized OsmC-like protein
MIRILNDHAIRKEHQVPTPFVPQKMSVLERVQPHRDVLEWVRPQVAKVGSSGGKFVKLHARVNYVNGHILAVDIRHGAFRVVTDEPSVYGGHDIAPAPLEFFVAGFAMCEAANYLWQIADMNLEIDDFALEVKTANAWSPALPPDTEETPELSRITLTVWIESSEPRERIDELVKRVARHCPAHNSLEKPLTINTKLRLNEGLPDAPAQLRDEEVFSPEPVA